MEPARSSDQFPCPFCHSGSLLLIGGTRRVLYYRCGECSEMWTVKDAVCLPGRDRQERQRPYLH